MTKDFRHVGRLPEQEASSPLPAADSQLAANRQLIIRVIYLSALGFFLAGVWILTGQPNPLPMPKETSFFLGIALVVSAVADLAVVFFLKRKFRKA